MKKSILLSFFAALFSMVSLAQSNVIDSILHQTNQRKFTVHKPTGYTKATPVPLVLMLHGGGGTMANAQGFTNLNAVSNTNGFLIAYPEGYGIIPSGGFSWADGRGTSADIAGIDDIGFIEKLLDTLLVNYNYDTNKIYICGFSNGGFMTQRLACEFNQKYAAMASLGSIMDTSLFARCKPARPIPMLFMLGTVDPFVPYNGGPMIGSGLVTPIVGMDTLVQFWKKNNHCTKTNQPINLPNTVIKDSSTVTLFTYTNCACSSDVFLYTINGGGHTWPGVEIPSYEIIAGQTNEDIQASVELWNFFDAHSLCKSAFGMDDNSIEPTIKIFPNPVQHEVLLQFSEGSSEVVKINLVDVLGKTIYSSQLKIEPLSTHLIDMSELTSGIYFIALTCKEGNKQFRIVKK